MDKFVHDDFLRCEYAVKVLFASAPDQGFARDGRFDHTYNANDLSDVLPRGMVVFDTIRADRKWTNNHLGGSSLFE